MCQRADNYDNSNRYAPSKFSAIFVVSDACQGEQGSIDHVLNAE